MVGSLTWPLRSSSRSAAGSPTKPTRSGCICMYSIYDITYIHTYSSVINTIKLAYQLSDTEPGLPSPVEQIRVLGELQEISNINILITLI